MNMTFALMSGCNNNSHSSSESSMLFVRNSIARAWLLLSLLERPEVFSSPESEKGAGGPDVVLLGLARAEVCEPVAAALVGLGMGRTNELTMTGDPDTRSYSAAVSMTASTDSFELAFHAASASRFASWREAPRQLGCLMKAFTNSSYRLAGLA